ncbi:hypothetical protein BKA93DRAFT_783900 [Sparassis latifolia]
MHGTVLQTATCRYIRVVGLRRGMAVGSMPGSFQNGNGQDSWALISRECSDQRRSLRHFDMNEPCPLVSKAPTDRYLHECRKVEIGVLKHKKSECTNFRGGPCWALLPCHGKPLHEERALTAPQHSYHHTAALPPTTTSPRRYRGKPPIRMSE